MFEENKNKKISLLPEDYRKEAEEKVAKIKSASLGSEEVDYFIPEVENFKDKKTEKKKEQPHKKQVSKNKDKDKKNKKAQKGFWHNFVSGLKKLFDHDSKVRQEKVIPQYNLPETKVVKKKDQPKVELDKKNDKPKDQVFTKEDKPEKIFDDIDELTTKGEDDEFDFSDFIDDLTTGGVAQELDKADDKKDKQNDKEEKFAKIEKPEKEKEKEKKEADLEIDLDEFVGELTADSQDFEKPAEEDEDEQKKKIRRSKIEYSQAKFEEDEDAVEISLVPKTQKRAKSLFKQNLILIFVWIFVSAAFVGGLYWFSMVQLEDLETQYSELTSEKEILEAELKSASQIRTQVQMLENKLRESKSLLDNHVYWTNFFTELEKYTKPKVRYIGFSGGIDDEIVLKAEAQDYTVAAQQLLVFQLAKDLASDVKISGISQQKAKEGEESSVSFNITLTLSPNIFKYRE